MAKPPMLRACPIAAARFALLAGILLSSAARAASSPDAAPLLRNGSFEDASCNGPCGWRPVVGARTAGAERSSTWEIGAVAVEGTHSLALTGDAATTSWLAMESDPVPVTAGAPAKLSASIRTEGVRQDAGQYRNCNVAIRFEDAAGTRVPVGRSPVAGTTPLAGDNEWTRVERAVVVPQGATRAWVLCFLSNTGTAWFDDVKLEIAAPPEWITVSSARITFHELPGDRLTDEQRARSESDLAEIEALLKLRHDGRVEFYKYPSVEVKERLSGRGGNAHVDAGGSVHSIWPSERHELVHVVARSLGEPSSALMGEGLAVALAGPWLGRDPDDWVREISRQGKLPSLASLLDTSTFRSTGDEITYPVAGSFVRWLLRAHGLDALKRAYPAGAKLEQVYGMSLTDLEREWLAAVSP